MTPEQFSKLPKFAQEHIHTLELNATLASRKLTEYLDGQTESPFSIMDSVCDATPPRLVRTYIQTNKVDVSVPGIELSVTVLEDDTIRMVWHGDAAIQPQASNSINLIPYVRKKGTL